MAQPIYLPINLKADGRKKPVAPILPLRPPSLSPEEEEERRRREAYLAETETQFTAPPLVAPFRQRLDQMLAEREARAQGLPAPRFQQPQLIRGKTPRELLFPEELRMPLRMTRDARFEVQPEPARVPQMLPSQVFAPPSESRAVPKMAFEVPKGLVTPFIPPAIGKRIGIEPIEWEKEPTLLGAIAAIPGGQFVGPEMAAIGRSAGILGRQARLRAPTLAREAVAGTRRALAEEAGFAKIPGKQPFDVEDLGSVDAHIKQLSDSIEVGRRTGVDTSAFEETLGVIEDYRRSLLESKLGAEKWSLYQELEQEAADLGMQVQVEKDIRISGGRGIRRPPKTAPYGLGLMSNDKLEALARQEGVNPYQADWWDSIDSVAVRDAKAFRTSRKVVPLAKIKNDLAEVQASINKLEAEALKEKVQPAVTKPSTGVIQTGMGIGEKPPQGGLFENLRGEGGGIPLASEEQLLARQARKAEIARGQQVIPEAVAKPPAPLPDRGGRLLQIGPFKLEGRDSQYVVREGGILYRLQRGGGVEAEARFINGKWLGIGQVADFPLENTTMGTPNNIALLNQMLTKVQRPSAIRAVSEAAVPAAKEPWQMTKQEYAQQAERLKNRYNAIFQEKIKGTGAENDPQSPVYRNKAQDAFTQLKQETERTDISFGALEGMGHWANVRQALSEGKPVPPEVLADYPELVAKAKAPAPAVAKPPPPVAAKPAVAPRVEAPVPKVAEGPRLTIGGVADKIASGEKLTLAEEQFRANNAQAVEEFLKAKGAPTPEVPTSAVAEVPPAKPPVPPPTGGVPPIKQVQQIQQKGRVNPESIPPPEAKRAHIETAAPDGPRSPIPPKPPKKGGGRKIPPQDPDKVLAKIAAKATKGERPDQTLLRLHEAAISSEQGRVNVIMQEGSQKLKGLGVGVIRRGQLVPKETDIPVLDELYNALHNPSKVTSGEVRIPKGYEDIYTELRGLTDWESAARLDFDPQMAMVQDYFYRGWKPPEGMFAGVEQGRPLVKKPAFKKPRVDATYQEMRDMGFEPLFWNPYQQWGLSRMQGTKYREQMELVAYLKGLGEEFAQPHAGGPIPQGWRVPEVGPAFEGKPFAITATDGTPSVMFTRRWIVPDRVANAMENIYGKRPNMGKFFIGGKEIDPLAVIDWLTFMPKRAKLIGSFFQQIDFLTRAGTGSWSRMVDALSAGQPIEAVKALARYPDTAVKILRSNFSPGYRLSLAKQLDSTVPLIKGRPGVHLKGIREAGLSTADVTIFPADMDKLVRMVAEETGILGKVKQILSSIVELESAMRRGLFQGPYPAAMITDIRNNIAPMMARMNPGLNDAQLNGTIARATNIKYSTIPASQSVIQNRVLREVLRRVFFSMGESEGLLRQAAGAIRGPDAEFWRKHWIGAYLMLIATAEVIHYASTGKHLPTERFMPVAKDSWGPLPFGYNTRFASPTIPLKGRGGIGLSMDIVGQMDTALRVLNPVLFLTSRESVPVRSIVNQASGTDFFGKPIDDVGPGGVVSRTAQLALDMFSPIGMGGIAAELARKQIPGAEKVIPEGEARLGMAGLGIQATGMNLRADTRRMRLISEAGEGIRPVIDLLEGLDLFPGVVSKRFDMALGVKGGEIELNSEQRDKLQWLTDDEVIKGVQRLMAQPNFNQLSEEIRVEQIKKYSALFRERARALFRQQLREGTKSEPAPAPTPAFGNYGIKPTQPTPTEVPFGSYGLKQPAGVR